MDETAYLDHAASTPMRAGALDAYNAAATGPHGNPSGAHRLARDAQRLLDEARDAVAAAVGGDPGGVIFTAGGTEADNLAIAGVLGARGGVAVCPAAEHHAVLYPVENSGGRVVAHREDGRVDLDNLTAALDEEVSVVSVMAVNNESGVIQPLDPIADLVAKHAPDAVLHTDAVQAAAWLDLPEHTRRADLVSISGHKFGGPMGVGALVVRNEVALTPLLQGGGQERGRRAGSHNVAGIVALGAAIAETAAERLETNARVAGLRDRLANGLLEMVPGTVESGNRADKVPGSCHLCFEGIESEALLFLLEQGGVYASAASSCASGAQEPSHVLAAMGVPRSMARGSLRLSLGASSTAADVDRVLAVLPPAVERLRARG